MGQDEVIGAEGTAAAVVYLEGAIAIGQKETATGADVGEYRGAD